MSLARLTYVICDNCGSNPAQPGDGAKEARSIARSEGYSTASGDVCPRCRGLRWNGARWVKTDADA